MFTGIITHIGKISEKKNKALIIQANRAFLKRAEKGVSISINGICLTLIDKAQDCFKIDLMPETEDKTNIKYLTKNDLVNLEFPVTPASLLSGHILQGHIDGISKVMNIKLVGNSRILTLSLSKSLTRYIVEKGSIAVNGISLTVIKAEEDYFTVGIIPYTWENTTLKMVKVGDFLNIEVDILAKYLKRLLEK